MTRCVPINRQCCNLIGWYLWLCNSLAHSTNFALLLPLLSPPPPGQYATLRAHVPNGDASGETCNKYVMTKPRRSFGYVYINFNSLADVRKRHTHTHTHTHARTNHIPPYCCKLSQEYAHKHLACLCSRWETFPTYVPCNV